MICCFRGRWPDVRGVSQMWGVSQVCLWRRDGSSSLTWGRQPRVRAGSKMGGAGEQAAPALGPKRVAVPGRGRCIL